MSMHYKFYITIASVRTEVFPLNFFNTTIVDERENNSAFYRRKFNGSLFFQGVDFDLFYLAETVNPCEHLIFEIEQKDSGADTYHDYWTGYILTTDGKFDLDRCVFEVTPKVYDDYYLFDINGEIQHNILDAGLATVTTNTFYYAYTRNLWLIDVIEYLVQQIIPAATVTSWFLNNPVNPVIGGVNKFQYLTIAQKSDIKRPTSTNPASVGMISFYELMSILYMYNLRWTYDGTTVRIEHVSFWDSTAGLDLRTQKISEKQNKYSYKRESMPKYERFSFMESNDSNYTEHTISYDLCANNEKTVNETSFAIPVTTEIDYIQESMVDDSSISDDGWVILANYYDGADYQVYYGTAYENLFPSYNYVNSWSFLLRAFFLHDRVLQSGYINGTAIDFINERKTKIQDIKAIVCYEDGYDPLDYITTELGEEWFGGQKGYVDTAIIHPTGHVDFKLVYGADDDTAVVMPPSSKNLHCLIDNSYTSIISRLSEPNIYDTYYWILWNDGVVGEVCQEIMIPAGTVYQEDVSDLAEIFASIKFNISDSSLTGWTFIYQQEADDNQPVVHTAACPAVPPVPPAIPAATTMIGTSQTSTCGAITIGWNASAGATYYVLFRKPNVSMVDAWGLLDTTVNTTYDDVAGGAEADGTTFTYKVQACNISGCSADSDEVSHVVMCL